MLHGGFGRNDAQGALAHGSVAPPAEQLADVVVVVQVPPVPSHVVKAHRGGVFAPAAAAQERDAAVNEPNVVLAAILEAAHLLVTVIPGFLLALRRRIGALVVFVVFVLVRIAVDGAILGRLEPQTLNRVQPVHLGVRPVRAPVRGCLVERHAPAADGDVILHLGSKLLDLALRSPAPDAQATRPRLPRHRLARRRGGGGGRRGLHLARGLHLGGRRDFGRLVRLRPTSQLLIEQLRRRRHANNNHRRVVVQPPLGAQRRLHDPLRGGLDARRGFTHDVSARILGDDVPDSVRRNHQHASLGRRPQPLHLRRAHDVGRVEIADGARHRVPARVRPHRANLFALASHPSQPRAGVGQSLRLEGIVRGVAPREPLGPRHLVFVVHEQRAGVARVGDDDVHPRVRAPRQHLQQRDARGGAALDGDSRVRSCFRGAGRVREEAPREARARTTTTDGGGASFSERRLRRRRAHLPVRGFHLPERVGAARLQDGAAAVRALVQERAEHVPLHVRRCRCVDVPVEHPEATREVASLAVAVGRVVVVRRCWFAAHHRGLLAVSRARQGGVDVVLREEPVLVLQGCHLGGRGRGASGSVVGTSRTPLGRPRQLANSWKKRRDEGCYLMRVAGVGLT